MTPIPALQIPMVDQATKREDIEKMENTGTSTAVVLIDGALTCLTANEPFFALVERTREQVIGQSISALAGSPLGDAIVRLSYAELRGTRDTVEKVVVSLDGRRLLLACMPGYTQGGDALYVVTLTTVAHVLPPEQLLVYTLELEDRVQRGWQEVDLSRETVNGLRNLILMSISDYTLEQMLDYVYEQARTLLGASGIVVLWASGTAGVLHAPEQVHVLYDAGACVGLAPDVVVPSQLLMQLSEQRKSIHITSQAHDGGIGDRLIAPMLGEDGVHGVVAFTLASSGPVQNAHQIAALLADQVIVAHGADRLQQKARAAAALQERERLARETHDAVTQSIYSLSLFAEAGRRLASLGQTERVQEYLEQLSLTAKQALKELRLLLYELQPAVLEQVGLVEALRQRLESVERRTGMSARLEVDGVVSLPAFVEDGLYRICQEALNNALKHASATEVNVNLAVHDRTLHLEISDNGIGFDEADPKVINGEGMAVMRERARLLNARLSIESSPQQGACVRVSISIPDAAEHLSEQSGLSVQGGGK